MSECHGSCHKAPQVTTCYMTVPGDSFTLTYLLVFGPVVTREKPNTALLIHMGIHVCVIAAQNPLYLQGLIQHVLQKFLPCPILKGTLPAASKAHHKAALGFTAHIPWSDPVLHPHGQHAQEEAQCFISPEIPQNWPHRFKRNCRLSSGYQACMATS